MSDKHTKQDSQSGKSIAAGITGAVIGAGVAVAATQVMKDKHTQEKVKKVFKDVTNQAKGYIDTLSSQAKEGSKTIEKKVEEGKKELHKTVDSLQEKIQGK